MIKIIAKTTGPKEKQEAFLAIAGPLVAASQAEPGNLFYNLHRSQENPEELVFLEGWRDQEAIDQHNASAHFTSSLPKLAELSSSEMTVGKYDVLI